MAKKGKDEVTLVTGDGRRYRIVGKVAKIVTTKDPEHTTLLGIFEPDMSMGLRVKEVRGCARGASGATTTSNPQMEDKKGE